MHAHRYGFGEGEHERIFPKLPYRMQLRIVCKPCNNNWMGQIENNAKAWALPMIVGNEKSLHETGEQDLATWAVLKTLVTHYASSVATTTGSSRQAITASSTSLTKHQSRPKTPGSG